MKNLTVEFSEEVEKEIDYIGEILGVKNREEVIKKALSFLRYTVLEQQEGSKIIFENAKKNERKEIEKI